LRAFDVWDYVVETAHNKERGADLQISTPGQEGQKIKGEEAGAPTRTCGASETGARATEGGRGGAGGGARQIVELGLPHAVALHLDQAVLQQLGGGGGRIRHVGVYAAVAAHLAKASPVAWGNTCR